MRTYICDNCGKKSQSLYDFAEVNFRDGEHPHCGSTMHTTKDLCFDCVKKVKELSTHQEWDDFSASK